MQETSSRNKVKFLLDKGFFEELHRQLALVRDAPGDDLLSYVCIGMWLCKLKTALPSVTLTISGDGEFERTQLLPPTTLQAILKQIADKGRKVRFVLWNGSNPVVEPARTAVWLGLKILTLNLVSEPLAPGRLRFGGGNKVFGDEVRMWCNQVPNTGVYLEPYNTSYTSIGTSNHQKVVVFAVNGKLSALVGGFNINEKYSAEPAHATPSQGWHDTAVLLHGPAAYTVQQEWLRRWNKQFYFASLRGETLPATLEDQTPKSKEDRHKYWYTRKVTIATTNGEARPVEQDIRALMIKHIQDAEHYIYIENYAFTDPALIDALAAKMAANKALKVMVLIHHPKSPLYDNNTLWSYLQYYTYIQLALTRFKKIHIHRNANDVTADESFYLMPQGARGEGTAVSTCSLHKSTFGWSLTWTAAGTGASGSCALTDIKSITCPPFMYGPQTTTVNLTKPQWPYPHSKMALFDDECAFVGSSNWTYRSMEYDGEMTAVIEDKDKVKEIRETLLEHWQTTLTIDNFVDKTRDNASKVKAGQMPANQCFIMPLDFNHFQAPDEATFKTKAIMNTMWTWF